MTKKLLKIFKFSKIKIKKNEPLMSYCSSKCQSQLVCFTFHFWHTFTRVMQKKVTLLSNTDRNRFPSYVRGRGKNAKRSSPLRLGRLLNYGKIICVDVYQTFLFVCIIRKHIAVLCKPFIRDDFEYRPVPPLLDCLGLASCIPSHYTNRGMGTSYKRPFNTGFF